VNNNQFNTKVECKCSV